VHRRRISFATSSSIVICSAPTGQENKTDQRPRQHDHEIQAERRSTGPPKQPLVVVVNARTHNAPDNKPRVYTKRGNHRGVAKP
jgi:hypothetical protein